jgi:tetratricopeptide (TPR) repeat protein
MLKSLTLVCMLITLVACQSNNANQPQSSDIPQFNDDATASFDARLVKLNYYLESRLQQGSTKELKSYIDGSVVKKHFDERYQQQINPELVRDTLSGLVSNVLRIKVDNQHAASGNNWDYLYSEQLTENTAVSHYSVEIGDDGVYGYIDFHWDIETLKIFNISDLSINMSVLEIIAEDSIITKRMANDPQLADDGKAYKALNDSFDKNDFGTAYKAWQTLSDEIRLSPIVLNISQVRLSVVKSDDALPFKKAIATALKSFAIAPLSLSAYYYEQQDYVAAINVINQTHDSLQENAKIQAELSMLYAYNKQYDEALAHSFKAIQLAPYDIEAHFVGLQVALLIEDYETALKILPIIELRFDVDMSKEVILTLEKSQKFIDSAEYQLWLKMA